MNYIIKIIFDFLFGMYFIATEQWIGGVLLITIMILNIKWFVRDFKEGGIDERNI